MSKEPVFILNGVNGQLEVFNNKLIIKRKGVLSKLTQGFFKGDKTIFIKQISGIQIKKGSIFTNGYIQFTILGGKENTKGLISATKDENTVIYKQDHNDLVQKIQAHIEDMIA